MANKANSDKKARNKNAKTKRAPAPAASEMVAPKIIQSKGGLAPGNLLKETLAMMEDDTRISQAAGRDFMVSLVAVVENELQEGRPVNLFHLVKIVPRYHTKGERMVNEEFGNPESKKVKKRYPAKVTLAVKTGAALTRAKSAELLPAPVKMQKIVGA